MGVEAVEEAGIEVDLEGAALLTNPLLNKGTAFTEDERTVFALHGLLPPHVGTLDEQLWRRLQAVRRLIATSTGMCFCADCRTPTRHCFLRY